MGSDVNNLRTQFPTNVARGDVSLINGATVTVTGAGGGDVAINARNVEVSGSSVVRGGILSGFETSATVAGNLKINATEDVRLANTSVISNQVEKDARGNGGGVEITTRNLFVTNGARLQVITTGQGDAGNVKITATGDVLFDGSKDGFRSGVFSTADQDAAGINGGVEINARNLSVTNGAQLQTVTRGRGGAGNMRVNVTGAVSLVGANTGIISAIELGSQGNAGNIEFNAGSLSLRDGARITAATFGQGNAGNVRVDATGAVSLVGADTGILSAIESGGVGNGGNIEFTAGSLSLQDGAQVTSGTYSSSFNSPGRGNAGDIKVLVKENIDIAGEGTSNLGFKRKSGIFAQNSGQGEAGDLDIMSAGNISLTKKGEISVTAVSTTGSAGNVLLKSNKLTLNQGSILAFGENGRNGSININNRDLLLIRNNSLISTISGNSNFGGRGGNIVISTPFIIALPANNDIRANAYTGGGANLLIDSQGLFGIQYTPQGQDSPFSNDITTDGVFGQSGLLFRDDPGKATQAPITTIDASNQISQVCSASNRQNKLTVTGRGGLPPNANDPLTSDVIWQDARAASPQPVAISATTSPAKLAAPAVGWIFDGKGKVTLLAAGTQGQPMGTSVVCPSNK